MKMLKDVEPYTTLYGQMEEQRANIGWNEENEIGNPEKCAQFEVLAEKIERADIGKRRLRRMYRVRSRFGGLDFTHAYLWDLIQNIHTNKANIRPGENMTAYLSWVVEIR